MRHLITGGSGFIGNLVARRLRERGETVRVLDVWSDPTRPADIEFVEGSVLDAGRIAEAMRDVDVVHHNAALVAQQSRRGDALHAVNVDGSRIVAEAAMASRVRAVVHVSSTAIYGMPPDGPITAHTEPRPFEPYGQSKLKGERVMAEICGRASIPLITIRPRATLGAGRMGIFDILFDWIAHNKRVHVIGDGSNLMQFIHAHDLMDFYMLALDSGRHGTYNVGTDRFGTLRDDLESLIRDVGSRSRVTGLPARPAEAALAALYHLGVSPLVPWHYRTYRHSCWFDVSPLLAMGWRPAYSNGDMLRESYAWHRSLKERPATPGLSAHRAPLKQGFLALAKHLS